MSAQLQVQVQILSWYRIVYSFACWDHAVGQEFDGLFGKWTLDEQDRLEVLSYRAGLTVAAAGLYSHFHPNPNAVHCALHCSMQIFT